MDGSCTNSTPYRITFQRGKSSPCQSAVATSLLQENKKGPRDPGRRRSDIIVPVKKRKPASHLPPDNIRYDCVDHFPVFGGKQQRCKNCENGYSRVFCSKCQSAQYLLQHVTVSMTFTKNNNWGYFWHCDIVKSSCVFTYSVSFFILLFICKFQSAYVETDL